MPNTIFIIAYTACLIAAYLLGEHFGARAAGIRVIHAIEALANASEIAKDIQFLKMQEESGTEDKKEGKFGGD